MMKIIVFGTGLFYRNRKEELNSLIHKKAEFIAFLDNNSVKIVECDGKRVYHPSQVSLLDFDMVVLMSAKADEMEKQLIDLGVLKEKVYTWDAFKEKMECGRIRFYCGNENYYPKEKILILSTDLNYNGGTMAAVYASMAMQDKGYNVCLAAPAGNEDCIKEIINQGLNVIIWPRICMMGKEELYFAKQFDVVVINVFQMLPCAVLISKQMPVLWWIHECDDKYSGIYTNIMEEYPEFAKEDSIRDIHIFAVSNIAQKAFNSFYPDRIQNILELGILDEKTENDCIKKDKITVGVVGGIQELKNQAICMAVIDKMTDDERNKIEIWFIGSCTDSSYAQQLTARVKNYPEIRLCGLLDRNEMVKAYEKIDVVLCASLEETLSLAIVEGMMHEKICVTSDTTGVASYIKDGDNGYVFKCNDKDDLLEKIRRIIYRQDDLEKIRKRARETYQDLFSMEKFSERLESAVQKMLVEARKR